MKIKQCEWCGQPCDNKAQWKIFSFRQLFEMMGIPYYSLILHVKCYDILVKKIRKAIEPLIEGR